MKLDNDNYRVSNPSNTMNGTATRLDPNNTIHRFLVVVLGPVISQVYQQFVTASWNTPGNVVPPDPAVANSSIQGGSALDPIAGSAWLIVWDDGSYSVAQSLSNFGNVQ